jgi:hypothetical protein
MGKLFRTEKPKAPTPVAMPDADSAVVKNTQDQAKRSSAARSGRQSTVLSQDGGMGAPYSSSLLGQ